jgi:c-di-GMP-related signal transduction protein
LIDRPLEEAVVARKAAESDRLAAIYDLARAYEVADWRRVEEIALRLQKATAGLGKVYCEAAGWAQQVLERVKVAQPV